MQRGLRITLAVAAAAGAVALSAGTAFADDNAAPSLPTDTSSLTGAAPSAGEDLPSADSIHAPALDAPKLGDSQKNSLPALGK